MHDLLIVGSGPAGLAAASHAQANKLNYVLLERTDHLSDTIYCYQARKYVMAEPTMIPARGDLPFKAGSREQILDAWQKHCDNLKLNVAYNAELKKLEKTGSGFVASTAAGAKFEGKNVILAMGTQGNPRKLGVPGEDMPHVLYRLVDPAEHKEEDVIVVGAGDSALA